MISSDVTSRVWSRLPSRRKAEVSAPVSESSEARQKFANAKAISSDMFFGRETSAEVRNLKKLSSRTISVRQLYIYSSFRTVSWDHIFTLISSSLSTMQRRDWRTCRAAPPSVQPTCSGTAAIKVKPVCVCVCVCVRACVCACVCACMRAI